jgi:hypothetical protein
MELHPLPRPLPGASDAGAALHAGMVSRVLRGEGRSVAEVLAAASNAMDAEDEAERYAADPVAYVRAHRPRRTLLQRLLYGRR